MEADNRTQHGEVLEMINTIPDFVSGDTVTINISFLDSAQVAFNSTGLTLYLTLKRNTALPDAKAAFERKYYPTGTNWTLVLSSADTGAIREAAYFLEIRMENAAGVVTSALEQTINVTTPVRRNLV